MALEVTRVKMGIVNAYLLTGDTVALVDTGVPMSYGKLEKALQEKGLGTRDIEYILITHHHFDHAGNVRRVKDASGAVLVAGAADAPVIDGRSETPPTGDLNRLGRLIKKLPESWVKSYQRYDSAPVDVEVTGGETLDALGLEVVALAGHTPGGVGFLDREGRRAFIGDLMSYFMKRPGMPSISASYSLEEIFASQEELAALGLEVAYPGHGEVIMPDASSIIADYSRKKKAKLL